MCRHLLKDSGGADDRTVLPLVGKEEDVDAFSEEIYLLLCVLALFGLWASEKKSVLEGRFDFKTLGMVCDTEKQCFLIGTERHGFEKRDRFLAIGEGLVSTVEAGGYINWFDASTFAGESEVVATIECQTGVAGVAAHWCGGRAGKAISFLPAILSIRAVLNLQYSVLHSRLVRRGKNYPQVQKLEAISRRVGERVYLDNADIRAQYLMEVQTCMRMVAEGREYRFVEERHMCVALVQTDAT